jgi:CheY-like chemotaxis protein
VAVKPGARDLKIAEQIVEDPVTGLSFQFAVVDSSIAPYRIRIFGGGARTAREIGFDERGHEAGGGTFLGGPSRPSNEEHPTGIAQAVPQSRRGETVLLVDDNETLRSVMIDAVTELGYRGLDAPDADAAIVLLESTQPIDLLVTDVMLPKMNGRRLAEVARRHRPDLKVLFVTGYAEDAVIRGEYFAPGTEILTKPFTLRVLGAKLHELLTS